MVDFVEQHRQMQRALPPKPRKPPVMSLSTAVWDQYGDRDAAIYRPAGGFKGCSICRRTILKGERYWTSPRGRHECTTCRPPTLTTEIDPSQT